MARMGFVNIAYAGVRKACNCVKIGFLFEILFWFSLMNLAGSTTILGDVDCALASDCVGVDADGSAESA